MCRRDNNGCLLWALVQQDALIVLSVFALMHMHSAENLKTQALLRAAARICKNTVQLEHESLLSGNEGPP